MDELQILEKKKQKEEYIVIEKDDMKSCIQEWMAQALNIEDLAKIYATIVSETDKQLAYMCQQFEQDEQEGDKYSLYNVIKKDGTVEPYNEQKIIDACNKAARRAMYELSENDYAKILNDVLLRIDETYDEDTDIEIYDMHNIVESVLEDDYPVVAKMYKEYRNYKKDFVHMMDKVYERSQAIRYIGDKSNANTDSALVATKRSLIYNELSSELYKKFFLTHDEKQAAKDGYIYIHDRSARLDTFNCCLFDVGAVMKNGFEMGNIWYNEPNYLDTAFDVLGDIILSTAAQQYGKNNPTAVHKNLVNA